MLIFCILAFLLSPSDYGVMGMAAAWIAFISIFSEMGFGAALIQRQKIEQTHFSTVFLINISVGILLCLLGIILSKPCALFFKTPQVQPVMMVSSASFIVKSFALTQRAIIRRQMQFRLLAVRNIVATLAGGIVGVSCAYAGYGVWSLVFNSLVCDAVGTLLFWKMSHWRPSVNSLSYNSLKTLWPYSSRLFVYNVFKYFVRNIDKVLIGYFFGVTTLGLYSFAYKMIVFPVNRMVLAVGNYLFPLYSRMQRDVPSIKSSFLLANRAINSIITPGIILVAFLLPFVITHVFPQRWARAIPLIQILAATAIAQALISPVGALMKALDRPAWLLKWSVCVTFLIVVFILVGMKYGIVGSTAGVSLAYVVGLPIMFYVTKLLINIDLGDVSNTFLPSTISVIVLAVILWISSIYEAMDSPVEAVLVFALSAIIYIIFLVLLDKSFSRMVLRYAAGKYEAIGAKE